MVDSTEYFVESAVTGGVVLTLSSPRVYGAGVVYSGSATGGSVRVVDRINVTVAGLDYTQKHTIRVVSSSSQCSGLVSATNHSIIFMTAGQLFKSAFAKYCIILNLQCSQLVNLLPQSCVQVHPCLFNSVGP